MAASSALAPRTSPAHALPAGPSANKLLAGGLTASCMSSGGVGECAPLPGTLLHAVPETACAALHAASPCSVAGADRLAGAVHMRAAVRPGWSVIGVPGARAKLQLLLLLPAPVHDLTCGWNAGEGDCLSWLLL